jgi:phosphate transport system permease protein
MGLSAARARRDRSGRALASSVQGVAIWLSGTLIVALAVAFITVLAVDGWHGLKAASSSPIGFDMTTSLIASGYILGIAVPLVIVPSFFAAAAGYDVALGGPLTRWLVTSLRVGPMTPAIAVGAAALWFGVRGGQMPTYSSQGIIIAAIALATLNLPVLTRRILASVREVPERWRVAALAAGAAPHTAFLNVIMPRALPTIIGALLATAGRMFGETAIVAVILNYAGTPLTPVTLDLWRRLTQQPVSAPGAVEPLATETLLLVTIIVAFRFTARLLQGRRRSEAA